MQKKILIANRGEIALRIIRACKELGYKTVSVFSEIDRNSLHVKFADESICIGSSDLKDSYLNIDHILSAAIATKADAIHPGYGFLAENMDFVTAIEKLGKIFIGPSSETLERISSKTKSKMLAANLNIPIVPGFLESISDFDDLKTHALELGFPIQLKADNGGGGKGIRTVSNLEELKNSYDIVFNESLNSFGRSKVFIEKYIEFPKHIEVQILGDKYGNIVNLGVRECSIQVRNQKIIEESPSSFTEDDLINNLIQDAMNIMSNISYVNAGTVEFLVKDNDYYFLEINPRIQVEHGITELVTNIDIVKEQIKIAFGNHMKISKSNVSINGHSIECRVNVTDFLTGNKINEIVFPGGNGVRIDTHIYTGYEIPPIYDALLVKLMVLGTNRKQAILKMRIALEQLIINGVNNNVETLYKILHSKSFIRGDYNTKTLENDLNYTGDDINE